MTRRRRALDHLSEDIGDHVGRETQDNIDRGMTPGEARTAALRKFGNVTRVLEDTRSVWQPLWWEQLLQDIRFGARMLRKSPAFTIAAVVTLALGIGANATVFTWLKTVIFNPLPGVDAANLVAVRWRSPQGNNTSFSWPDFVDIRGRNQTLQGLAVGRMTAMSLGSGDQVDRVWGMLVSANYFDTMGVKPALGRVFGANEDQNPGGHPIAIISHHLWQTRFGGDAGIIGRPVLLNKQKFTIVGVTPEPFQGSILGLRLDMWVPAVMQQAIFSNAGSLDQRASHWLEGWARIKPNVTPVRAEAELTAISAQLSREFYKSNEFSRAVTTPVWKEGSGRMLWCKCRCRSCCSLPPDCYSRAWIAPVTPTLASIHATS